MLDLLAKGGPFFLADLRGAEVGITPAEADAILQDGLVEAISFYPRTQTLC